MRKVFLVVYVLAVVVILSGCGGKSVRIKSRGFSCRARIESDGAGFEGLLSVDDGSVTFEVESPPIIKGVKFTAGIESLSAGFGDVEKSAEGAYLRELSITELMRRCFASLPDDALLDFADGVGTYRGSVGESDFCMSFTSSGFPTRLIVEGRGLSVTMSDHGPAE